MENKLINISNQKGALISKDSVDSYMNFLDEFTDLPEEAKEEIIIKGVKRTPKTDYTNYDGEQEIDPREMGKQIMMVCTENGIIIKRIPNSLRQKIDENFDGGADFLSDSISETVYNLMDTQPDLSESDKYELFMDTLEETFQEGNSSFNGEFDWSYFGEALSENIETLREDKKAKLMARDLMESYINDDPYFDEKLEFYDEEIGFLEDDFDGFMEGDYDTLFKRKGAVRRSVPMVASSPRPMFSRSNTNRPVSTKKQARQSRRAARVEARQKRKDIKSQASINRKGAKLEKRLNKKEKRREKREKRGSLLGNILTGGALGAGKKLKSKKEAKREIKKQQELERQERQASQMKAQGMPQDSPVDSGMPAEMSEASTMLQSSQVDSSSIPDFTPSGQPQQDMPMGGGASSSGGGGGGGFPMDDSGGGMQGLDLDNLPEGTLPDEEYPEEEPIESEEEPTEEEGEFSEEEESETAEFESFFTSGGPKNKYIKKSHNVVEKDKDSFMGFNEDEGKNTFAKVIAGIILIIIAYWAFKKLVK
jgi:hypothetical protein